MWCPPNSLPSSAAPSPPLLVCSPKCNSLPPFSHQLTSLPTPLITMRIQSTAGRITSITLRQPDDFHLHLRQGPALQALLQPPLWPGIMARAIVMPNTKPPLTTGSAVAAYAREIREASHGQLVPLPTLYLTDAHGPAEIDDAIDVGGAVAAKLYPAHATTGSAAGVTDVKNIWPALGRMAERGMVLCIHGEVTDRDVDFFEREATFLQRVASQIVEAFPTLKVVMEHVSTAAAVEFVINAGPNVAATITPQHLMFNRNAIFDGT